MLRILRRLHFALFLQSANFMNGDVGITNRASCAVFMVDEEYSSLKIHLQLIADHITVTAFPEFMEGSKQRHNIVFIEVHLFINRIDSLACVNIISGRFSKP